MMMSIAPAVFILYYAAVVLFVDHLFFCVFVQTDVCWRERERGKRARIVSDKTHVKCHGRP